MDETFETNDREARAGKNQSLFREVNERLHEAQGVLDTDVWPDSFICECANESCLENLNLSRQDYEHVRENARRFFVAPSEEHVLPAVERLVEQGDCFWVVEKFGEDGAVAERFDPRARGETPSIGVGSDATPK